ncbi:MAG TPA: squalene/phytoene synthase family protein [Myxococcota bacterium]|nr:squalene/phytoene synthase family protein [Myxococcota bacterium]
MSAQRLDAAYRHCAAITRASGSSFLAAFWMFPREQRRALHAIYAFCRLADDIADDEAVRGDRVKLIGEWRRVLEEAYLGKSDHPVGIALGDAAQRFRLREQWLQDLLSGVEADLRGEPIARFRDLEHYCYCVASTIGLLVVAVRGLGGPAVQEYAYTLGVAVQLTNVLRDVGADARAGRVYLAAEDLARLGVAPAELAHGELTEPIRLLLALYAERARIRYERAQRALPLELRRSARPAQAMGAIYRAQLELLQRAGFPCLTQTLRLSRRTRLGIAARVWLGAGAAA